VQRWFDDAADDQPDDHEASDDDRSCRRAVRRRAGLQRECCLHRWSERDLQRAQVDGQVVDPG
jgi:hypothetical protein